MEPRKNERIDASSNQLLEDETKIQSISRVIFSEIELCSNGGEKHKKKHNNNKNNGSLAIGNGIIHHLKCETDECACAHIIHIFQRSARIHASCTLAVNQVCNKMFKVFDANPHIYAKPVHVLVHRGKGSQWRCACLCERFFCIFTCLNQSV